MAITQIDASARATPKPELKTGGQITRDDFMKLLIAQLQNQDPLSPLDNQQFAVQLATFNSLEQLVGVNEKLESLASQHAINSTLNGAALIGKQIVGRGSEIHLNTNSDTVLSYELTGNAGKVTLKVVDSDGQMVRQLEQVNQSTGIHQVAWDGRNDRGERVAAGIYKFEVVAADANGNAVPANSQVHGTVTGLDLDGPEPMLRLGELTIPLSLVTSIR
jgi:flagellar basal-body rod modification protein FlgD